MRINWDKIIEIYCSQEQLQRCHQELSEAVKQRLIEKGNTALAVGPFSVMDKNLVPPSGDKHDFIRSPTYAWPNPDTPDGLPYIWKDGETGPAVKSPDYDQARLGEFTRAIKELSWAYFASGEERYAERAVFLLETWFINPATKMNPNLTFSKYTPGMEPPYPTGVISTHTWVDMMQAIGVLAGSAAWTLSLHESLQEWFKEFLEWLQSSEQGIAEDNFKNNRGIWYDAQLISFALFVGDESLAKETFKNKSIRRLDEQVAADGSLPEELKRTASLSYSIMTLRAFSLVALMGERIDADLWHHRSSDGGDLRLALDFIAPYLGNAEAWPYEQIKEPRSDQAFMIWAPAALAYQDPSLRDVLAALGQEVCDSSLELALFA